MRSFTLATLLTLLGAANEAEAFVTSPSCRRAFLPSTWAKQQPLSVSTELTGETTSIAQSSFSSAEGEGGDAETSDAVSDDVEAPAAVVEEAAPVVPTPKRIERVRHTLFVGNLPFEIDEATVRSIMGEYGEVVMVSLPRNRDSGLPRGFAFVDMATPEEMESAIAGVNGKLVDGRVLRASPSLPKDKQPKRSDADNGMGKVYVGNISYETTKEMLVDHFAQFGTVFEVYMPTDVDGRSRGYGFVSVKKEEIESVIENASGTNLDGREVTVTMPLPRGERPPRQEPPPLTKIYVGNLSFYTVQETLEEVFSEFGEIHDCYIPPDPTTGGSRGFGFVTMEPESAQQAIAELDYCEIDGRSIRVNEAQPKQRRSRQVEEDVKGGDEGSDE